MEYDQPIPIELIEHQVPSGVKLERANLQLIEHEIGYDLRMISTSGELLHVDMTPRPGVVSEGSGGGAGKIGSDSK